MSRYLKLGQYHWCIVFAICGGFAIAFAFSSYNLFHLSKANFKFLREFGMEALMEGALIQSGQILLGAAFSLFCYLGFKLCEAELVERYRVWKGM